MAYIGYVLICEWSLSCKQALLWTSVYNNFLYGYRRQNIITYSYKLIAYYILYPVGLIILTIMQLDLHGAPSKPASTYHVFF